MEKSESIGNLAKALAQAQSEMQTARKDSSNPFFKSKYADLNSIWEACRPALNNHKLAIVQTTDVSTDGVIVETTLLHESSEWISGRLFLPLTKQDAQGVGSALSYGRRYGLAAMVGVVAEDDDDGNAASGSNGGGKNSSSASARPNHSTGQNPNSPQSHVKSPLQAVPNASNPSEKTSEQIAEEILKNNWVERKNDGGFRVSALDDKASLVEYRLSRNEAGKVVCDCFKFIREVQKDGAFRCEHILALKEFLLREPQAARKWNCHPATQKRAEELIEKIINHPLRTDSTTRENVIEQIKSKTDKGAPESLSQESIERVIAWLEKWLESLDKKAAAEAA